MIVQIIETGLKSRIRKDDELKLKLAKANGIKVDSLNRWLYKDDVMLTTATNLDIIREWFNLSPEVELTEPKEIDEKELATK